MEGLEHTGVCCRLSRKCWWILGICGLIAGDSVAYFLWKCKPLLHFYPIRQIYIENGPVSRPLKCFCKLHTHPPASARRPSVSKRNRPQTYFARERSDSWHPTQFPMEPLTSIQKKIGILLFVFWFNRSNCLNSSRLNTRSCSELYLFCIIIISLPILITTATTIPALLTTLWQSPSDNPPQEGA